MTPLLRSSPPINSISHTLFRCRHSNSRDTVASSPFYSHHAAKRRSQTRYIHNVLLTKPLDLQHNIHINIFLRCVQLYVANLNQSRSAFIRAPNFCFICHISSVIFVCRLLAASFCVPLPPSCIVRRHRSWFQQLGAYFPFFPQVVLGFRVRRCRTEFLSRFLFFTARTVIKCGLVILRK